eukprot:CAMPEP_0181201678 /NCGR_PEP_ID=MMETSP1096-20121128/18434_1 /TAXON_ID=156174 ORGANISM="Chrysochromulina ericina, Strain CCMP281" /NCGR_SAMPLE_ID=MMETSP1096 /ASSEMBLY_ACC=CAM_ASM_000453 /LENGTH=175 /DNA_ID=CAMNT_0023292135 /DNA_START=149 /DNA_END=678 /DNA_ORIENTATION=-
MARREEDRTRNVDAERREAGGLEGTLPSPNPSVVVKDSFRSAAAAAVDHIPEHRAARPQRASHRIVVGPCQAKTRTVTRLPLEIIQERPVRVPAQVHATAQGFIERLQHARQVSGALRVGFRTVSQPRLRDEEWHPVTVCERSQDPQHRGRRHIPSQIRLLETRIKARTKLHPEG